MSDEDGRKTEASGSWATQLITSYDFPFDENKNRLILLYGENEQNSCSAHSNKNTSSIFMHQLLFEKIDNRIIQRVEKNGTNPVRLHEAIHLCNEKKKRVLQLWLTISHQWYYDWLFLILKRKTESRKMDVKKIVPS